MLSSIGMVSHSCCPGWPQTTEFCVPVLQEVGLQMSATMPVSQISVVTALILSYSFYKEPNIGGKENGKVFICINSDIY